MGSHAVAACTPLHTSHGNTDALLANPQHTHERPLHTTSSTYLGSHVPQPEISSPAIDHEGARVNLPSAACALSNPDGTTSTIPTAGPTALPAGNAIASPIGDALADAASAAPATASPIGDALASPAGDAPGQQPSSPRSAALTLTILQRQVTAHGGGRSLPLKTAAQTLLNVASQLLTQSRRHTQHRTAPRTLPSANARQRVSDLKAAVRSSYTLAKLHHSRTLYRRIFDAFISNLEIAISSRATHAAPGERSACPDCLLYTSPSPRDS